MLFRSSFGSLAEWHQEQEDDEDIKWLRRLVETGEPVSEEQKRLASPTGQLYASLRGQLLLDGQGLLRYKDPKGRRVVLVPRSMQGKVMTAIHQYSGHRGRDETTARAQRFFYFPRMSDATKRAIAECQACQEKAGAPAKQKGELKTTTAGYPFQKLAVDFVGPLPTGKGGYKYILTVMDTFTRWMEAFPLTRATGEAAADKLLKEVFCRYGMPEEVHSDRGSQFTSTEFRDFLRSLKIQQSLTPAYNPKSNPVERAHRTLNAVLNKLVGDSPAKWPEMLPLALHSMRTSVSRSTGQAPYKTLFG